MRALTPSCASSGTLPEIRMARRLRDTERPVSRTPRRVRVLGTMAHATSSESACTGVPEPLDSGSNVYTVPSRAAHDRPGVRHGRRVEVAGGVGGPDADRVPAARQRRVRPRRGAACPPLVVEAAAERCGRLGRAEVELRAPRGRHARRTGREHRVRGGRVGGRGRRRRGRHDRPAPRRRRGIHVPGRVGCPHVDRVGADGQARFAFGRGAGASRFRRRAGTRRSSRPRSR